MNTETKSYEAEMIDELCAISSIQDTHTVCHFCYPTRGYTIVCQNPDGYCVITNNEGWCMSGGPWDRSFAFQGFFEDVISLGGES